MNGFQVSVISSFLFLSSTNYLPSHKRKQDATSGISAIFMVNL